eukprot:17621-Heterococcus_DN1.PRE.4
MQTFLAITNTAACTAAGRLQTGELMRHKSLSLMNLPSLLLPCGSAILLQQVDGSSLVGLKALVFEQEEKMRLNRESQEGGSSRGWRGKRSATAAALDAEQKQRKDVFARTNRGVSERHERDELTISDESLTAKQSVFEHMLHSADVGYAANWQSYAVHVKGVFFLSNKHTLSSNSILAFNAEAAVQQRAHCACSNCSADAMQPTDLVVLEQKAASTLKAKAKLYQKLARGEVQGVEVGHTALSEAHDYSAYSQIHCVCFTTCTFQGGGVLVNFQSKTADELERLERDEPSDDDTASAIGTSTAASASGKHKTAAAAATLSGYDSDDVEIQDDFGRDIIAKRGSKEHKRHRWRTLISTQYLVNR